MSVKSPIPQSEIRRLKRIEKAARNFAKHFQLQDFVGWENGQGESIDKYAKALIAALKNEK